MNISQWLEKVYGEDDFGRSIAIAISGAIGLTTYLLLSDPIISLFSLVIAFPIFRLIASALRSKWEIKSTEKKKTKEIKGYFNNFSVEELEVIREFVRHGGCVLSFRTIDGQNISLPDTGVNSLMQRGVLEITFLPPDCVTEGMILDIEVFDMAQNIFKGGNIVRS